MLLASLQPPGKAIVFREASRVSQTFYATEIFAFFLRFPVLLLFKKTLLGPLDGGQISLFTGLWHHLRQVSCSSITKEPE
jgi:hypothetical protein